MDTNVRDMHRDKNTRVRRSHPYGHRDHGDRRKHTRQVKEDDHIDIHRDRVMHRDKNSKVSQGPRYGHRDYDHHIGRHRKHKRQVQEEDHREIGRQQHDISAFNGIFFSQERCHGHSKDLGKKRLRLEELDDSPPLLPSSTDSDITSLPRDAVFCILDKLLEPIDHLRVAIVSKEWDAVAKDYNHTTKRWSKQQQQVPMLIIPTGTEGEQKLYSVTERRIYDHIRLPIPYNEKCCGSNYGWLAIIDKSLEEITILDRPALLKDVVVITYRITLQNPFRTGIEAIHLPPLKYNSFKFEKQYTYIIPHVILSADPTLHPENYAVLAFCNHHLPFAFIKGGQKNWVQFTSLNVGYNISMYSSAIFYRNQIYAVNDFGGLMMKADVSNSSPIPVERLFQANRTKFKFSDESYLVESTTGDLLLCVRRPKPYYTLDCGEWLPFSVYKIVFTDKDDEFYTLETENIGDEAIFLDYSLSICVSASKFPGCQPNSIYYTTNDCRKSFRYPPETPIKCEMGVYNLESKVVTTLYSSEDEGCWNNYMPHWVLACFKL